MQQKKILIYAVVAAVLWFALRIVAGKLVGLEKGPIFGALSNILFILVLVFIALVLKYRVPNQQEKPSFLQDFRDAMRPALVYVALVSLFIALYYGVLTDDAARLRELRKIEAVAMIDTEEELLAFKQANPTVANMSREQILQGNEEKLKTFVNARTQAIGGLLALAVISMIYSLMAVFFWRTFVKRI
jgi:hypothetical protein